MYDERDCTLDLNLLPVKPSPWREASAVSWPAMPE
jgi:hypothetical protein